MLIFYAPDARTVRQSSICALSAEHGTNKAIPMDFDETL